MTDRFVAAAAAGAAARVYLTQGKVRSTCLLSSPPFTSNDPSLGLISTREKEKRRRRRRIGKEVRKTHCLLYAYQKKKEFLGAGPPMLSNPEPKPASFPTTKASFSTLLPPPPPPQNPGTRRIAASAWGRGEMGRQGKTNHPAAVSAAGPRPRLFRLLFFFFFFLITGREVRKPKGKLSI